MRAADELDPGDVREVACDALHVTLDGMAIALANDGAARRVRGVLG